MNYIITEDDYDSCVIDDSFVSWDKLIDGLEDYTLGEIITAMQSYDDSFVPKLLNQ